MCLRLAAYGLRCGKVELTQRLIDSMLDNIESDPDRFSALRLGVGRDDADTLARLVGPALLVDALNDRVHQDGGRHPTVKSKRLGKPKHQTNQ